MHVLHTHAFLLQVLKVIAPKVRYHPPGSHQLIPGFSVNIKGLLSACDSCNIAHPSEKVLRRHLRQTKFAITTGHQRFLQDQYHATDDVSMIPRSRFSQEKACVTIPREILPDDFYELLNNGTLLSLYV